jgi:hypothetical protein
MERVDAAEKEASEVLHTLLSVERVKKQGCELNPQHQHQVRYASQYRTQLKPMFHTDLTVLFHYYVWLILFGLCQIVLA